MSNEAVVLPAGGVEVPVGAVVETGNGKRYVVIAKTKGTVTLVPMRWWRSIPWWFPLSLLIIVGFVVSELLWQWWI